MEIVFMVLVGKVNKHLVGLINKAGGMIPKVNCCVKALANGVKTTSIIDGRLEHSLLLEVLTDGGAGTMITGCYNSYVWSLACVLLLFLVGKSFVEETHDFLSSYILTLINGNACDCEGLYVDWLGKVSVLLDTSLGSDHVLMKELLQKCLSRPSG
ncbi:acetylglutamate kinase [Tanacetum coccineum]